MSRTSQSMRAFARAAETTAKDERAIQQQVDRADTAPVAKIERIAGCV
jgi:hypothetical protein